MGWSHVGHDCRIGDGVTIMNAAMIAGHVDVGQRAVISGTVLVHQFVRIGEYAMIGGGSPVTTDVPPYFMVAREHGCVGINLVGLRRGGFPSEVRTELKKSYQLLYRSGLSFRKGIDEVEQMVTTEAGRTLVEFLRAESKRGIMGRGTRMGSSAAKGGEGGELETD